MILTGSDWSPACAHVYRYMYAYDRIYHISIHVVLHVMRRHSNTYMCIHVACPNIFAFVHEYIFVHDQCSLVMS